MKYDKYELIVWFSKTKIEKGPFRKTIVDFYDDPGSFDELFILDVNQTDHPLRVHPLKFLETTIYH